MHALKDEPFLLFDHPAAFNEGKVHEALSIAYRRHNQKDGYGAKQGYDDNVEEEQLYGNAGFIRDIHNRIRDLTQRDQVIINFGSCMAERVLDF